MLCHRITRLFILLWIFSRRALTETPMEGEVKVFTVATKETDGYRRLIRYANYYNINVERLGMGRTWHGSGSKVNILRPEIEKYKKNQNMIIIFIDSLDVVFTSGIEEILTKFKTIGARILFSAEVNCSPEGSLVDRYPTVPPNAARFLNSGAFIAYAPELYEIMKKPVLDGGDDQLYYTEAFLNEELRTKLRFQLDTTSQIFQSLVWVESSLRLDIRPNTGEGVLHNIHFQSVPNIIHANGPSKHYLNSIANYLGTFKDKHCIICDEDNLILDDFNLPIISLAIFAERPVPFFEEYLAKILALQYPKKKINIFIHCYIYHEKFLKEFINIHEKEYKSAEFISSHDMFSEKGARKFAAQQALIKNSDYLFVVGNEVHIDDPNTLMDLISFNRSFIAPVVSKPNDLWSNLDNKHNARSHDYVVIVQGNLKGMWNVPFVASCYLLKRSVFEYLKFENSIYDPDMAMCEELRNKGVFLYIVNLKNYGHLIDYAEFNTRYYKPDFYTMLSNPVDWTHRYIHPEYFTHLLTGAERYMPCPDVYWFPIVSEQFCDDLIAIMENYGKWSDGSSEDERIQGYYEAVPTKRNHFKQVGLERLWLKFLRKFVRPLQEAVFTGYYHNPAHSIINFVVRYKPDEQQFLRARHDSSTFTINIALNTVGVDFIGGGYRFVRYNCSVADMKKGWMLMHPGRLTHYHEELNVTQGTRYSILSFIDP